MARIEKWFINSPRHAERGINRAEKLLNFIDVKEGQHFLEVGCGNGAVSKHVARKYRLNVTGVDIDPEQIQLAQNNIDDISDIHFSVGDGTSLSFPDSEFDIVLAFGIMHHISNWLDALVEIRRVLKPKGYFIYADLMYKEGIAKLGRSFKHSYGITTTHDLKSFTESNHFSTIHTSMKNGLIWYEYEFVYQSN